MNLFESVSQTEASKEMLCPGAVMLRRFAQKYETELFAGLREVTAKAPFRHMVTPGGFRMSVAMTNCGAFGWITDETGYRYDRVDPETNATWPEMPDCFLKLASSAATEVGFDEFLPDACLINRYEPGSKLSLHQDKNERDFEQPIVSVSLGVSATFLFGGSRRNDETERIPVEHGDVIVWGGPARLRYHGVMALKEGFHPLAGGRRFNLTFRKAT
jgi:alkylated DNA repair protein (DNA oxidative demethylase)